MLRDDLEDAFIGIWGLGLMGGSLAMALKPHCKVVAGIDHKPEVVDLALAQGVVSRASTNPQDILPDADIIILAVPVGVILKIINQLPSLCGQPVVVLDLGSTKADIARAYQSLPAHIYPVGGHPMCGKSVLGLENADPNIYQRAPFMLYPLPRSRPRAFHLVEQVVRSTGANPLVLDPDVHDRWVAGSSHLPYLVACALALSVPLEAVPMLGTGFASTSRLAETSTSMMLDVLETNRANLVDALEQFQNEIGEIAAKLQASEIDALEVMLNAAASKRMQMLLEAQHGGFE